MKKQWRGSRHQETPGRSSPRSQVAAIECSHVPSPRASGKLINHFSGSQQSAADDISLGPGKRSSLLEKKTWDSRRGSFPWADRSLGALVIVVTPPSRIPSACPIGWRGGEAAACGLGVLVFGFGCSRVWTRIFRSSLQWMLVTGGGSSKCDIFTRPFSVLKIHLVLLNYFFYIHFYITIFFLLFFLTLHFPSCQNKCKELRGSAETRVLLRALELYGSTAVHHLLPQHSVPTCLLHGHISAHCPSSGGLNWW